MFSTSTKGILLELPKNFLKEILDKETQKYLRHKSASAETIIYHTIAHVLQLLIASVAGVNPDVLWYGWDIKQNTVAVWERYEGSSGICETFRETLQEDPARIWNELHQIIECPIHKAEKALAELGSENLQNPFQPESQEFVEFQNLMKMNPDMKLKIWRELFRIIKSRQRIQSYTSKEYIEKISERLNVDTETVVNNLPTCIDGCPLCIGVPYCVSGRDEQYTNISLKVAQKFVRSLEKVTKNQEDVAEAVMKGGKVVRYDGEKYTLFFI